MQVCDITRSEEVAGTVTIAWSTPDGSEGDSTHLDVGKQALDAFRNQDWQALHTLTPAALRKKDPKKSDAARKAGQTRAANRASKAAETAPAAPSGASAGQGGTAAPTGDDGF